MSPRSPSPSQTEAADTNDPLVNKPEDIQDEDVEDVDPAFERKLKWKLDLFILPLISSVYFFAAMGRSDLANAKIAGLTDELKLSPGDYSNAATVFLVAYVVFQLPGTLLVKKLRAPFQFGGAMLTWGFLTMMTVLIQNQAGLLVLRFLIGAAEAFVQGGVFYLSFWYQYDELATRGAIFYSMSTLAGAFNGLIAYAIAGALDGARGWRAWRWIFLVEGAAPCAFAFVVAALLPAGPAALRRGFTPRERARAVRRSQSAHNSTASALDLRKVHRVLLDLHFWLFTLIACGVHFCLGSLSNFLPDIIQGFGFETVDAQLFTVVVYACAFVGVLFWCRLADRTNARGLVLAAATSGSIVGYVMLIATTSRNVRYAGTCVLAFFIFPTAVLQLTWAAMNFVGYTRRGSALAFFNIISQLFAISGTQAYTDPPYYHKGHIASLAMVVVMTITSLVLRWYLSYLNRKKRSLSGQESQAPMSQESIEELGDKHPDFMYTI
ncbi:putative pantothenate transporter [Biscogniauxia sp. FL1348]|nr:putative pantothenate transporter [Biscogniauxia sp. FL1348]